MPRATHFLALTTLLASFAARAEEAGFTPLFNGKDLAGWVPVNVAPDTFTVRDDMIVCDGKPTGVMRTDRHYENYVLELEYKHLVAGGNAGLFVWSDPVTSAGVPFTRSIEVQILDGSESENHTSHGDVFAIHGAKMKPDRPHPRGAMRCLPSEKRAKPAGEWNHYRVVCNDGALKLSVNGKEVSGASACWPRKGYICLESEGGTVHYRNIRIKELPSTNPKPEEVAPLDEGLKSIYTGVDLSGWKHEPGQEAAWQPKDWILSYNGTGGAKHATLWTGKEYSDLVLIVDWRLPKDVSHAGLAAVQFGGASGPSVDLSKADSRDARPVQGWNRYVITINGSACKMELNGRPYAEQQLTGARAAGPIGIRPAGPIELANLYVKELK